MFSNSCAFFKYWCAQFCGFSTSISGVALPKMTTLLRDKLPKCIEMNFSLQKSCWISLCITLDNYSHHWASLDIMTCVQATAMMVQAQVRNPDLRARKCAFDTRALAQCFLQWSMSGKHLEPAQAILFPILAYKYTYYALSHSCCLYIDNIHTKWISMIHHISNIRTSIQNIQYTSVCGIGIFLLLFSTVHCVIMICFLMDLFLFQDV